MPNLLIVDDEKGYREVLSAVFGAEGYTVATAPSGREAIVHLNSHAVDVIISDVRMPDMDGIELLKNVRSIDADMGMILMTAFGTIDTAREAFKLGADDFIQKPFNNEELKLIVRRSIERRALVNENRALKQAQRAGGSIRNIIGTSPKMRELFAMIETVAKERSTVLVTGESGTGKELVARAIHDLSDRADRPFIPVNCGAVTETLLESELFGFMKGSFTGADQNRPGVFESADKGTIFLDEIGDMPQSMQVKMLRVLQDGKVRRIGSSQELAVDSRVIAATNRDLMPMVEDGEFRQDLFYRLSVIPIHVPPLRERRDDIPMLAENFVRKFSSRSGKTVAISSNALASLSNRDWLGNVRELEHAIERAVALTPDGGEITEERCTENTNGRRSLAASLPSEGLDIRAHIECIERDLVAEALRRTAGNRTRAAELLKMEVHQFRYLLTKHDL
ncbi:MAG: sigma-54 dependent transcriptional regulator [Pyrinomonadaceae bacterium]